MSPTLSKDQGENGKDDTLFDHSRVTTELENINSSLQELNASLSKSIIKCHLLEVDLASQFNPNMVQIIRQTEKNCDACTKKLEFHFSTIETNENVASNTQQNIDKQS